MHFYWCNSYNVILANLIMKKKITGLYDQPVKVITISK